MGAILDCTSSFPPHAFTQDKSAMSTTSEQKYDSDVEKGASTTAGRATVSPVANGGVNTESGIFGQVSSAS